MADNTLTNSSRRPLKESVIPRVTIKIPMPANVKPPKEPSKSSSTS